MVVDAEGVVDLDLHAEVVADPEDVAEAEAVADLEDVADAEDVADSEDVINGNAISAVEVNLSNMMFSSFNCSETDAKNACASGPLSAASECTT